MPAKSPPSNTTEITFDVDELLALARLDIERSQLEAALTKLKQVLADKSAPADAYAIAGRLYAQIGLWDKAKSLFQHYLEVQPSAINERFQLGMVHFDAGQLKEARTTWEELLKTQPHHPPALFYQSLSLSQEGKVADAKRGLELLLKTAAADNLYFGRAKELLQALESRAPTSVEKPGNGSRKDAMHLPPSDIYKTEH